MFITAGLALYIIVLEFIFGTLLGLAVAALVCRSRLRLGRACVIAFPSGLAFLLAIGLSGWASFPTAVWNNHLAAAGSLAGHAMPLAFLSCIVVAAIISFSFTRRPF